MGARLRSVYVPAVTQKKRSYTLVNPELNEALDGLLARAREVYKNDSGLEIVREVAVSALRLLKDGAKRGDLRLVNHALKELRHSFRVFAPYKNVRKAAVFGSARTPKESPEWKQAETFAERIAEEGWMVITGAGGGIMAAAQGGAGREASFGVNIRLPFEQRANETIEGDPKLINFRYFFTRKITFVKESHAIALLPGGFGTLDEGFEALTLIQTGKSEILPVVFLDAPGGTYWRDWFVFVRDQMQASGWISEDDFALFKVTDDVEEAVREVLLFYRNYHSMRWVRDELVMRVRVAPDATRLMELNKEFAGLLAEGPIRVGPPHPDEGDELPDHARLFLRFNRRRVGRLRQLIDRLNEYVEDGTGSPRDAVSREIFETAFSPEALEEQEEEEA